jgi:hypothetical protein
MNEKPWTILLLIFGRRKATPPLMALLLSLRWKSIAGIWLSRIINKEIRRQLAFTQYGCQKNIYYTAN